MGTMLRLQYLIFLPLLFFSVAEAQLSFDKPPPGGATVVFPENTAPGTPLYALQASNQEGIMPMFAIASSLCNMSTLNIIFTISNLDQLLLPAEGLDAENCANLKLTFTVTAGASATSGPLTIIVTDVNEHPPSFNQPSYIGEVWKNDGQGQSVNDADLISASDPDISNLPVSISISGAQTTFAINSSGLVYVNDPSGLAALASPTVLTILASDGGATSTASIRITVHDDPCTSTPCQNSGACSTTRDSYHCTCLNGYTGSDCEQVDYCFTGPCQNGFNCTNGAFYTCGCTCPFTSNTNCSVNDPNFPCQNNGVCLIGTIDQCNCTGTGFDGQYCTEIISTSSTSSTSTSATTIPSVSSIATTTGTAITTTTTSQQKSNKTSFGLLLGIIVTILAVFLIIGSVTCLACMNKAKIKESVHDKSGYSITQDAQIVEDNKIDMILI